jgi:hypothetical protein
VHDEIFSARRVDRIEDDRVCSREAIELSIAMNVLAEDAKKFFNNE